MRISDWSSDVCSSDLAYKQRPDAAIVVFGETPYAEFQGDIPSLQLRPELRRPFATMRKLKAAGIPVVAVMVTGRPLFVNEALNEADAFVTAWLPRSEEHTSELQSLMRISYAVFCLKKHRNTVTKDSSASHSLNKSEQY